MDVVPRGTELEIQLRRGVGQALYTCNNIHIDLQEFIGHKQRNTDTKELYGVPYSGSWIPSQTIIVQLLTKRLVTNRETCRLLFEHKVSLFAFDPTHCSRDKHSATTYKQKEIEGDSVPPMPGLLTKK